MNLEPNARTTRFFFTFPQHLLSLLLSLSLISACFPYFVIFKATESDLQPAPLCLAVVFIFVSLPQLLRTKIAINFWIIFSLLFTAASFGLLKFAIEPNFTFRSLAYFLSPLIFFVIGVESLQLSRLSDKFLFYVSCIWFLAAVIQRFIKPDFAYLILNAPRTTAERGVTSLAAEPSFYAIQILMLIILNWIRPIEAVGRRNSIFFKINIRQLTEILLMIQIIFFAQSFLGVLLLAFFIFMRAFSVWPLVSVTTLAILGLLTSFFHHELTEYLYQIRANGRAINLVWKILHNPATIVVSDQSMGERLTDIILSFYSFLSDPFFNVGNSTAEWKQFTRDNMNSFPFLKYSLGGSRIMSGIGTALYELGTVGFILFTSFLAPTLQFKNRKTIVASLTLVVCLINATQLALPLAGIILGTLALQTHPANSL
jgi:hypothetical protein